MTTFAVPKPPPRKKNPYKTASRRFENKKARDTDGRRVPLSGAGSIKGDVQTRVSVTECKISHRADARGEKLYTIRKADLEKIEAEAKMEGLPYHRLSFRFAGQGERRSWSILPDSLIDAMLLRLAECVEAENGK